MVKITRRSVGRSVGRSIGQSVSFLLRQPEHTVQKHDEKHAVIIIILFVGI